MCSSWLSISAFATVLCAVASSSSYGPRSVGFSDFSLSPSLQFDDFHGPQDTDDGWSVNPVEEYVRRRRRIQGGPPKNFRPEDIFNIEDPLFNTREPRPQQTDDRRNPTHSEIDGLRALPIRRPFEDERRTPSHSSDRSQSTSPTFQKLEPVYHQKFRPEVIYDLADDAQYMRSPDDTRPESVVRYPSEPSQSQPQSHRDANKASSSQYEDQPQEVKYHPHYGPVNAQKQHSAFSLMDDVPQQQAGENKPRFEDLDRAQISEPQYRDFLQKQQEELQLYRQPSEEQRREVDQRYQPEQSFEQPRPTYKQPQHQYEQSQRKYEPPQQQYEQPQRQYEQPQQQYQEPQRQFEQSQQQFVQPEHQYEQRQQFEQPQQQFNPSQSQFEQPQHTRESPEQGYKQQTNKQLQHGFEQPQESFEHPQQQPRSPLFFEETREVDQPSKNRDTPSYSKPHNSNAAQKGNEERSLYKKHSSRPGVHSYKTKKPVPLQPVYSKDQPPSFADAPLPFSEKARENEVFDHLPEYQETFRRSSPAGESKEKRQAHHGHGGGYMDHNGLEFVAAASAAEHAHGKGGDGRLTFQLHGQKGPHSYRFGFDTGKGPHRQFRYEERDNDGTVKGRYGYYDSHGKLQMYNYSAHPDHGYEAAEAH